MTSIATRTAPTRSKPGTALRWSRIATAVEEAFGYGMTPEEMVSLDSIGDIKAILRIARHPVRRMNIAANFLATARATSGQTVPGGPERRTRTPTRRSSVGRGVSHRAGVPRGRPRRSGHPHVSELRGLSLRLSRRALPGLHRPDRRPSLPPRAPRICPDNCQVSLWVAPRNAGGVWPHPRVWWCSRRIWNASRRCR